MTKPTKRCEHCRIGYYQATTTPYLERANGQMVVVSNMPAHRCDICGDLEYDAASLGRLEYLIDHPAPEYEQLFLHGKRPFPSEQHRPLPTR